MTTDAIPILHVKDAGAAVDWYVRLGFEKSFEHRFGPGFPLYVGLRREGAQVHLSEHAGDAPPHGVVYIWVDDVDAIGAAFGIEVDVQPWAREVQLVDPDHNRLRIGQPIPDPAVDTALGDGTAAALVALERAMWEPETRGDITWMDEHLADDFGEFGLSGRTYSRAEMLAIDVGPIEATLDEFAVRPLGRDAALVTYRTTQAGGVANRASTWVRGGGGWLLAFHQGTPTSSTADEGA